MTTNIEATVMTTREREILSLLKTGRTSREIAANLDISERTVKFHTGNILRKLRVRNRTEAVALALEQGWMV